MDAQGPEEENAANDVTAVTSKDENRFAQRRADALTTMAETTLRHGPAALSSAERYQVMIHVTAETLSEGEAGRSEFECGQRLAPDTARRIACDGSLLRITDDTAGNPLDIGRKTRAVPPAMQRALRSRDGGCCFPGCTHDLFVDAHHIKHWADGGETSLDNLTLLCRRHHRLVHEGGFGIEWIADGALCFTRPDGRVITEQSAAARRAQHRRFSLPVDRRSGLDYPRRRTGPRSRDQRFDSIRGKKYQGRALRFIDVSCKAWPCGNGGRDRGRCLGSLRDNAIYPPFKLKLLAQLPLQFAAAHKHHKTREILLFGPLLQAK